MTNKSATLKIFMIIANLLSANFAMAAESLSFPAVWNQINASSAAQQSSLLLGQALTESKNRSARHWLPRVYLNAKTYQSNDSGSAFFGLLEQRSLLQSDFNPDAINHPEAKVSTTASLGLDLPLYEGGAKTVQVEMTEHMIKAQALTTSQIQMEQYSRVGLAYASISVLDLQKQKIVDLNHEIELLQKNYQLGNKSNPVGYSGLLGMKSLSNRLTGLIRQYEAERRAYFLMLNELGLNNPAWTPVQISATQFVDQFFSATQTSISYQTQALKEYTLVSEQAAEMQKAKFLPRIGAFAESSVFKGTRDTNNSYMAGLYLQWNLFDPSEYGSLKEASLKTLSAKKSTEAALQVENAEKMALDESIKSYRDNLVLLNESYKLLMEQSTINEKLFRNGSINALQVIEVLSRRTDLVAQQSEAELGLLKAASQATTKGQAK